MDGQKIECSKDWITVHSIANYGKTPDSKEKEFILIGFGMFILLHVICKGLMKQWEQKIDHHNDTPSDYSIMVENIPRDQKKE